ncbi:hypothetical protein K402DRAFT_361319 [Aulographum hederae CBS 113979]|uniref:Ribosomal protein S15 n=1 Tax=Aulographum hederae CBS 113979 TaxID=1176131 RepID=A0A6G1GR97_9PEZI|nr:hypothetical protein K402DRAFT_361319 [Aulographum hederae CBS 113979]
MPPRIPQVVRLQSSNAVLPSKTIISLPFRPLSTTSTHQAKAKPTERKHRDPYAEAQSAAKKAANLSRRAVVQKQRAATLGDPVRGVETDFVRSFDSGSMKGENKRKSLAHFLTESEVRKSAKRSLKELRSLKERTEKVKARPMGGLPSMERNASKDEANIQEIEAEMAENEITTAMHEKARTVLHRLTFLHNSSAKTVRHANIQRCIEKYGRHNTDQMLLENPGIITQKPTIHDSRRAGPDTGSSEVQIAILTAKIRAVANMLENGGKKDLINKRNLRLLVHRRQKLLAYLRRKEKGGPRWQNCIQTLGLTDGTWKGEISL